MLPLLIRSMKKYWVVLISVALFGAGYSFRGGSGVSIRPSLPVTFGASSNDVSLQWLASNIIIHVPTASATKRGVVASADFISFSRNLGTVGPNRGNNSVTLTVGSDAPIQRFTSSLLGNQTVTLSTTGAANGDWFRIVRTGLGIGTLDVGGLRTIPTLTSASVLVVFDGTNWILASYGTL